MSTFVHPDSIVRRIWGRADYILFIFAGASAEFALNKAVDWLYFTGKLPADPIGRLFSTVTYARKIVFSTYEDALTAIDTIAAIHQAVEQKRQSRIPDWAYRDVLYMLIHYSIASFELLDRKMSDAEKQEVYDVFFRVGHRMGLQQLPHNYDAWLIDRENHLQNDLVESRYTADLFKQYRKHLGTYRYYVLTEAQKLVIPNNVARLLHRDTPKWLQPSVSLYKMSRMVRADQLLMLLLMPTKYRKAIEALNVAQA